MNIGYDAKRAFLNHSGLGTYSRNLICGMMELFVENEYVLFTTKQKIDFLKEYHPDAMVKEPSRFLDRLFPALWRTYGIAKEKDYALLDVYHGLSAELPIDNSNFKGKKIVTIHDLIFERYPSYYKALDRYIYKEKTKHACKTADVIIAASEQTKSDLIEMYHITESKIKVIYQMCHVPVTSDKGAIIKEKNLTTYGIEKPFLIYISSFNERKNHLRLLEAFEKSHLQNEYQLVLVGQKNKYLTIIQQKIQALKLEQSVVFLHNVTNEEMPNLLKQAKAMVYISEFEGFGIPILEGYSAQIPVLTSNTSSMKEIGHDACLLVNPFDIDAICQGLIEVLKVNEASTNRIQKGTQLLASTFSKTTFIQSTFQTYL